MKLLEIPELQEELKSGRVGYISAPASVVACFFDILCQEKATGKFTVENALEFRDLVNRCDRSANCYDQAYCNGGWILRSLMYQEIMFSTTVFCHFMAALLFKKCDCIDEVKLELDMASRCLKTKSINYPPFKDRIRELTHMYAASN